MIRESIPFPFRIVNIWNSLPASVISANNINTFQTDWISFG